MDEGLITPLPGMLTGVISAGGGLDKYPVLYMHFSRRVFTSPEAIRFCEV